jgi:hypothetical protein
MKGWAGLSILALQPPDTLYTKQQRAEEYDRVKFLTKPKFIGTI